MLRLIQALVRKDITLLLARSSGLGQCLLLGLLLVFVFSLSRGTADIVSPQTAATIFWLSSTFCQVLIFNQLYALEERHDCRLGLLLCPAPVQSIWLAKAASGFCLLVAAQCLFLPASIIFLNQSLSGPLSTGLLSLLLTDVGMCTLGALLGALAQGQAVRESLLGIILFPLLTPLLLAGIRLVAQSLGAAASEGTVLWLGLAAAFDAVFLGAGLLLFVHIYAGGE